MSVFRSREETMSFVLAQLDANSLGPRLGRLLQHGTTALQTPHYVATTSRGVVPHMSQDVLQRHSAIRGVYISLEDCWFLPDFTCSLR